VCCSMSPFRVALAEKRDICLQYDRALHAHFASVLQCDAVSQYAAVCCIVWQRFASCYIVLILCRLLQHVAMCPHPEFHPEFMYMENLSTGLCSYIK